MNFVYRIIAKFIIGRATYNFKGNLTIIFPNKEKYTIGTKKSKYYFKIINKAWNRHLVFYFFNSIFC